MCVCMFTHSYFSKCITYSNVFTVSKQIIFCISFTCKLQTMHIIRMISFSIDSSSINQLCSFEIISQVMPEDDNKALQPRMIRKTVAKNIHLIPLKVKETINAPAKYQHWTQIQIMQRDSTLCQIQNDYL